MDWSSRCWRTPASTRDDVRCVLMQNVTDGAYEFHAEMLGAPIHPVCRDTLAAHGHLGAMDVVLNLDRLLRSGELTGGDLVLVLNTSPVAAWAATPVGGLSRWPRTPSTWSSAWSGTWTRRCGEAPCWRATTSRSRPACWTSSGPWMRGACCSRSPAATTTTTRGPGWSSSASPSTSCCRRSAGDASPTRSARSRTSWASPQRTMAFIDDQPADRAEVAYHLPEVRCYAADEVPTLPARPEFSPTVVTVDARQRREMYQAGFRREAARAEFSGPDDDFLRSLALRMRIGRAGDGGAVPGRGADPADQPDERDRRALLGRRPARAAGRPEARGAGR